MHGVHASAVIVIVIVIVHSTLLCGVDCMCIALSIGASPFDCDEVGAVGQVLAALARAPGFHPSGACGASP